MKNQLASCFGAAFTLALASPSAFAALTLTNGNFEADATQTNNVTGWYDLGTTGAWWESTWAGPNVSPNSTSVLGLSYAYGITNWAYQSIGTKSAGDTSMTVGLDVGSFTDATVNRDLGVTISLYKSDGTFVPADNTDVAGASGVTLVGSYSIIPNVAPGTMVTGLTTSPFDLTGVSVTDVLYLRFINYSATPSDPWTSPNQPWTAVDNVTLNVIPEPRAALLGGLGLLVLLRRRRG